MKKITILFLCIALTHVLSAQKFQNGVYAGGKQSWFDLQIAQHIGLNSWSSAGYVNEGFPAPALTEFRGVLNSYIAHPYVGGFVDMGLGIMPAPKMGSFSLNRMPMPYSGTQYYLREMLSESGNSDASVHVKMTFGLFGIIPSGEKLTVMPHLGVGFLTMPQRKYEMILKEQGSNIQYRTIYSWNSGEYGDPFTPGYLIGRLNFKYRMGNKSSLLLGLEYTRFFNTLDFYGKYTNTFNANIERDFSVKGNKMNMLGISVGISFM